MLNLHDTTRPDATASASIMDTVGVLLVSARCQFFSYAEVRSLQRGLSLAGWRTISKRSFSKQSAFKMVSPAIKSVLVPRRNDGPVSQQCSKYPYKSFIIYYIKPCLEASVCCTTFFSKQCHPVRQGPIRLLPQL